MNDTPSDTFPDPLSVNPASLHYNAEVLGRDVGIRFNGKEKTNVEESHLPECRFRTIMRVLDRTLAHGCAVTF